MWAQIVLHLLSNAFKFSFEGRIEVRMRFDREALLEVRDHGVGIRARDLAKLNGSLGRVEAPRSRSREGLGVGLAIARELSVLHGGRLLVDSAFGVGTVVRVFVPPGTSHLPPSRLGRNEPLGPIDALARSFIDEASSWSADGATAEIKTARVLRVPKAAKQGRVLVVDDHADMRAYIEQLLEPYYDVESVADAEAALRSVERSHPDLVLTDLTMPGIGGIALVRALRENELTRALSVMVASSGGEDARTEAISAGGDDFIAKPFSARELLARVAAHVSTARIRRDSSRREAQAREEAARASERAAEAEVRLAETTTGDRRLRLISEALRGATWELDIGSGRVAFGSGVPALSGYPERELGDRFDWWIDRIEPADQDRIIDSLHAAVASGARSWCGEYRFRRRDGTVAVLSDHAVIDRDAEGRAVCLLAVVNDVTAQRGFEALPWDARRTEVMSTLTVGVAHEVNNMMTAVIGFGELALERTEPESPLRGDLCEMLRAARRTARITEQFVGIASRAHRGTQDAPAILVVEDEAIVRRLARRILERAGFRVLEATNGGEALELATGQRESIDLVLSDVVMPEVGGRELGRLLHARGLELPILFMSASDGDDIARHELLDADAPFLQKPFAPERLVREVRNLLARANADQSR
ncbi:MAG: response regulator [Polyangiaceae bacterium]|nr:response regulator [Polyangiaceae bacterium]